MYDRRFSCCRDSGSCWEEEKLFIYSETTAILWNGINCLRSARDHRSRKMQSEGLLKPRAWAGRIPWRQRREKIHKLQDCLSVTGVAVSCYVTTEALHEWKTHGSTLYWILRPHLPFSSQVPLWAELNDWDAVGVYEISYVTHLRLHHWEIWLQLYIQVTDSFEMVHSKQQKNSSLSVLICVIYWPSTASSARPGTTWMLTSLYFNVLSCSRCLLFFQERSQSHPNCLHQQAIQISPTSWFSCGNKATSGWAWGSAGFSAIEYITCIC